MGTWWSDDNIDGDWPAHPGHHGVLWARVERVEDFDCEEVRKVSSVSCVMGDSDRWVDLPSIVGLWSRILLIVVACREEADAVLDDGG